MKIAIACLQMASHPYDWDYNIGKAEAMIREAASSGANICLLPEVFIPGYSHTIKNFQQAESVDGSTISTLKSLAEELNLYISGSFIEKSENNFYNTMVVIGPEGLLGKYHKKYVFSLEQKYWKCGKEVAIVQTEFGDIGLGICADMHYPKLWKQYAGKVDLILICSAWPGTPSGTRTKYAIHEEELCKDLPSQISRVLQLPTAYCNACHPCEGKLPLGLGTMACAGFSKIVDKGTIVASIDSREEQIIQATVNTSEERPIIDPSNFKNWIEYPLREKIPKFFVETFAVPYARLYYQYAKKKYSFKYDFQFEKPIM
jgi:predicted amidohydrolase